MPSALPAKRNRRIAFQDDDDGGVVVAEASSSLRHDSQRKKARVSAMQRTKDLARPQPDQSDDTSTDESDEETNESEREASPSLPPAASQYEAMRDQGFEHLTHTEEDDQRATQRLKSRPELIGDNHAALNGILESIEVFNFMCHQRLNVKLGALLNFIVGENGSGKSAILTAITLCLGGKASSTNRGAKLSAFIKEGQEHGSLIVKIKNQGPDAYRPEIFGDSIIVERHFSKSGSSGFKLKGVLSNRIISTKKADVDDVVDYYCLQVDNPLNVLSQDNARQFLNSATPATKYSFFMKGTQLEQLDSDLALFTDTIENNAVKLEKYKDTVDYLREKYEKAKKLKETVSQHRGLRDKARVYSKQLVWAQVAEQEIILQEKENEIVTTDEEIAHVENAIQEKTAAFDQLQIRVTSAQQALDDLKAQEEPDLKSKVEQAATAFDEIKTELSTLQRSMREINAQLSHAKTEVENSQAQIEEEEKRLEQANGGAVTEMQARLDEAKEAVKVAEQARTDHATKLKELQDDAKTADQKKQEADEPIERKRREMSSVEAHIRTLSQNQHDPLAGYHPKMRQLLKLLEGDRNFREKPLGPLGLHIQLSQPEWSSVLETTLSRTLNSFVVSTKDDQKRLQSHMVQLNMPECDINITRPGLSLSNLREPDEGFDTILRVLKIDDERVRNQLILANNVEQIVLVPTLREAQNIMMGDQPPRNAMLCITHHSGGRSKRGEGITVKRRNGKDGPSFETSTISAYSRMPRIKSDTDFEMNRQKEALVQLRSELQELETVKRSLQQTANRFATACLQHKREANELHKAVTHATLQVENIVAELDQFDGMDSRLQMLRGSLEEAITQRDHYGQQYGEATLEMRNHNETGKEAKKALSAARREYDELQVRVEKAQDKLNRIDAARKTALQEKNAVYENLEVAKVSKERAERTRNAQMQVVQDYIAQASEMAPQRIFIAEGESYTSIEHKYNSLLQQIKRYESQIGKSEEEINDQLAEATEAYRTAEQNQEELDRIVQLLKQALEKRFSKWRVFQRMISAASRTNFGYLLSERGFRGRLLLDHVNKKLAVEVEPDETRQDASGRKTTTLSGGEKSFSSICLLLAIWDAMGSPLRCLDEFDVFMDAVNRGISTKMLVQAARRSVSKQFILITPNAIEGNVKMDKDVSVIRQVFTFVIMKSRMT